MDPGRPRAQEGCGETGVSARTGKFCFGTAHMGPQALPIWRDGAAICRHSLARRRGQMQALRCPNLRFRKDANVCENKLAANRRGAHGPDPPELQALPCGGRGFTHRVCSRIRNTSGRGATWAMAHNDSGALSRQVRLRGPFQSRHTYCRKGSPGSETPQPKSRVRRPWRSGEGIPRFRLLARTGSSPPQTFYEPRAASPKPSPPSGGGGHPHQAPV